MLVCRNYQFTAISQPLPQHTYKMVLVLLLHVNNLNPRILFFTLKLMYS